MNVFWSPVYTTDPCYPQTPSYFSLSHTHTKKQRDFLLHQTFKKDTLGKHLAGISNSQPGFCRHAHTFALLSQIHSFKMTSQFQSLVLYCHWHALDFFWVFSNLISLTTETSIVALLQLLTFRGGWHMSLNVNARI